MLQLKEEQEEAIVLRLRHLFWRDQCTGSATYFSMQDALAIGRCEVTRFYSLRSESRMRQFCFPLIKLLLFVWKIFCWSILVICKRIFSIKLPQRLFQTNAGFPLTRNFLRAFTCVKNLDNVWTTCVDIPCTQLVHTLSLKFFTYVNARKTELRISSYRNPRLASLARRLFDSCSVFAPGSHFAKVFINYNYQNYLSAFWWISTDAWFFTYLKNLETMYKRLA